jgi:hypothetical protein
LDKDALNADPKMELPSSDSLLTENPLYTPGLKCFNLLNGSACINAGKRIADNGGYDFWKNSLLQETDPNIGAWQGNYK